MKKTQRILAILGIVLLLGLYLSTFVFALLGKDFFPMFMASLFSSFVVPVLIWTYGFVYKLIKKEVPKNRKKKRHNDTLRNCSEKTTTLVLHPAHKCNFWSDGVLGYFLTVPKDSTDRIHSKFPYPAESFLNTAAFYYSATPTPRLFSSSSA